MIITIVQKDDPVLRAEAAPVDPLHITSDEIQRILATMAATLETQPDGVAIAAPQIGVSLQIFVVSPKAFAQYTNQPLVYINPQIIKYSKNKIWLEEGCLSVRWDYGQTHRYEKVTVEAYDERGKKFSRGASGLLAQIFQHEIDHLHGILFCDHARNIRPLSEEEIRKYQKTI